MAVRWRSFRVLKTTIDPRAFRNRLAAHPVSLMGQADYRVSQALYFQDPGGILIEAYVD